jgi:iron complex outermembrane recepter protein
MIRIPLLRGVSACALSFALVTPALATHTLPTIDVNGQQRRTVTRAATATRPASAPATGRPTTTTATVAPAPTPEPSPVVSRWAATLPDGKPAFVQRWQLPNTVASITRQQIERKINIIDTEDAVRYMPSLFVRKRNNGDTQAVLQTRTWGISSSARSLVYADDLLLTALIGNDNTIGAPRWGLVAPEEIERVDMLYGPFAAQYAGNSVGGVLKITTRMPEKLEVTAKETVALQDFSLWGTSNTFWTNNLAVTAGDKINDFS